MKVKSLGRVQLFATIWTAARQAPPSMGFSRQEHWSGAICTRHMCLVATKLDSAALDFHFVQFANICYKSMHSHCILVSLAMQKLLSLIKFHLFIFAFILITLGEVLKKILL